jgi:molybdopterin molybdotransferase
MSEFLELLPPQEALARLLDGLPIPSATELIATADALGRVTAEDVLAPLALPSFSRSTVDGYAVRAVDTHGATESLPAYLRIRGEVSMGGVPAFALEPGQCALIHTGGMLPEGADAVVMVEFTQPALADEVEVLRAVSHGENVLRPGEDVQTGQTVIAAGTRLRPAEIGGLMALGLASVAVTPRPSVAILSSGDEVIAPGEPLRPGQVYDVNSYALKALVQEAGGAPVTGAVIPDQIDAFRAASRRAMENSDVVVFTAGSSVSTRDLTAQAIGELGAPGVLVHGVSVRPGKPTILALCAGKPVIGLPGNPVSALVIARLFLVPVIEALSRLRVRRPRAAVPARLSLNVSSQAGREDWVAVRLHPTETGHVAEPIFGKSNLIFTLARADGLVRIPPAANGLEAGTAVEVLLM